MDGLPTDIALSNDSVAGNRSEGTVLGVLSSTDPNVDRYLHVHAGGRGYSRVLAERRQPPDGSIVRLRGLQYLHDPRAVHCSRCCLVKLTCSPKLDPGFYRKNYLVKRAPLGTQIVAKLKQADVLMSQANPCAPGTLR